MELAEKQQLSKQLLDGLILTLPEDQRGSARELMDRFTSVESAAEYLSSHVLRQEDYSRQMNEGKAQVDADRGQITEQLQTMKTERDQVNSWWTANKEVLVTARQMMDQGKWPDGTTPPPPVDPANPTPPAGTPPANGTGAITAKDLDDRLAQFGDQALPVIEIYSVLNAQHLHAFKEPLTLQDWETVRAHPKARDAGLEAAYQEVFKEKLDAQAAEIQTQHDDALRKEGRDAALEEISKQSGPPYAFQGQTPSTALDVLESADDSQLTEAQAGLDPVALAREYQEKVAAADPSDPNWVG